VKMSDHTGDVLSAARQRLTRCLIQSAVVVERRAKQLCPRRTGRLVRSITHQVSESKAVIGTNVEYGPVVELGSRPHLIEPVNAKALWWPEAPHPVKIVHHPGTRPQPYLRPALEASIADIKKIFGIK